MFLCDIGPSSLYKYLFLFAKSSKPTPSLGLLYNCITLFIGFLKSSNHTLPFRGVKLSISRSMCSRTSEHVNQFLGDTPSASENCNTSKKVKHCAVSQFLLYSLNIYIYIILYVMCFSEINIHQPSKMAFLYYQSPKKTQIQRLSSGVFFVLPPKNRSWGLRQLEIPTIWASHCHLGIQQVINCWFGYNLQLLIYKIIYRVVPS